MTQLERDVITSAPPAAPDTRAGRAATTEATTA